MAARKAETETPQSSVPEVRAKSAVVGTDLQLKVASSDPPYEAITLQIAYLMSVITKKLQTKTMNGMAQSKIKGILSSLT